MTDWNAQKTAAEQVAGAKWGAFRKFIASNPLTGFWIGVALGAGIILAIGKAVGSLV